MEGTITFVAASPPEKAWPRVLPGGLANAACLPGKGLPGHYLPGSRGRRDGIPQAYRILIASLSSTKKGPMAVTANQVAFRLHGGGG